MKIPDVDIDFQDRDAALDSLLHIPASIVDKGDLKKHNVGVYFHSIPTDPLTGYSSIPHKDAAQRGYFKLDFLNLGIYKDVRDEAHLNSLLAQEPIWDLLEDPEITEGLFHLGGEIDGIPTYEIISAYQPRTILQLAMILALIRPRKKHLIGLSWSRVEAEIWLPGDETLYGFKKAHAISYAHVVVVQMNLLMEQALAESGSEISSQ